ncbi:hypothetical protein [Argonema antarcticum]|uniref:hypothetical protein n=1 Tax=Argonema antarcticum TaxID=2942763 RepID=UPI0020138EC6|nr:hypothetical protein [Argonema antarcticum]MCL1472072.1 hypothetical protein [Argonema antarcticum A004/B2]
MMQFLAQITPPTTGGEGSALDLVNESINLARATSESWNGVWISTIDPIASGLWVGLVSLGITLAAVSILFLTLTSGKDIIEKQSWSELAALFIWPIVIMLFLGANGKLLANTAIFTRSFAYKQVQSVLEAQLGELTFRDAISNITISNIGKQQLENLYSDCRNKVGEELVTCWNSKREAAQKIVDEAERQAAGPAPLRTLRAFAETLWNNSLPGAAQDAVTFINDPGSVFREKAIPIIRFILYSLQWAFVNILEAALLLTALFSPIAMGLSLLPLQGRPIWAWATGFLSLFGVQLGYNIIVGLAAVVLVNSGAELASDVAFLFFISIFAPGLALLIAGGGGIALYNGIAGNAKQLVDVFSNAIGAATTLAINKGFR